MEIDPVTGKVEVLDLLCLHDIGKIVNYPEACGQIAGGVAMAMGYTLTDTFLVEAIFSWPGIGSYISSAVTTLDYPAIIGVTLFGATCYIILNLIADIIIASDPRVRL